MSTEHRLATRSRSFLENIFRTLVRTTEAFFFPFVAFLPGSGLSSRDRSSRRRREEAEREMQLRQTFWRLRRAYEDVVGRNGTQTLSESVGELRGIFGTLLPTLKIWIDCIETLVQDAEQRFGSTPGKGPQKAREVKSALTHLLIDSKIKLLPGVPDFVQPLILEAAVSWAIDAVVLLINQHEMWTPAAEVSTGEISFLQRLLLLLKRPFRALGDWLTKVITSWVLRRAPLSPQAAAMVQRIQQGNTLDPTAFMQQVSLLLGWMGQNRQRLVGVLELIAVGAREAERFIDMTGPEKREYVQDLVLLFMEEEGLISSHNIMNPVIRWFVGAAIDSVVQLFNKRRVFQ